MQLDSDAYPWEPWPSATPPEYGLIKHLTPLQEYVCLPGHALAPRGRYGFVGLPSASHPVLPSPSCITEALQPPTPSCWKTVVLGYELYASTLNLPLQPSLHEQPYGWVFECDTGWIVDHLTQQYAEINPRKPLLNNIHTQQESSSPSLRTGVTLHPCINDDTHSERIQRLKEHIQAGDIYQANLTRRLHVQGSFSARDVFAYMLQLNPVGHNAWIHTHAFDILSNSMETFVTYNPRTRHVATYPIKGTHAHRSCLEKSTKDQSEHVMIVDLLRNDLGKVCTPGSVHVDDFLSVEGYQGVWHHVSKVYGTLDAQHTAADIFQALFPGGSITGAPKHRATNLLSALESEPRGFYTGSVVLMSPQQDISSSILIRSLVRDTQGWHLSVGGGIVYESTAQREIEETWEKVSVILHALNNAPSLDDSTTE